MEQEKQQKEGFFKQIQKLFSSDVVIHNIGGNQLKVVDTSKIQTHGALETNSLFDKYNRIYTTSGRNAYNTMNQLPTSRIMLYTDYEAMDTDSIIASTLDIISDEVSLRNDFGEVLQIQSSDETLQKILYNLFYDILNIEFNLWSWTRNMCKYGDFYLKLEISEKFGVYNVIPFSSYTMIRIEGENPQNPSEVKFKYDPTFASTQSPLGHFQLMNGGNNKEMTFENYEIAHFRLLSDYNYLPYGRSYLEPARKIFKQLTLMEDAMLIHRIVRAPEKRTFFVNVGNIPPNEVESYMQKTINKMKKTPYVDPKTGEYNLKYNIQNILEDFYIPVRGGDTSTRIETTKGLDYTAIDDINYLRDKLFAALKVPKAYFGYEKDLSGKCISPDTKIPLLDGRTLTVDELINEYNNGIKNYVYSLDEKTNNIVPGEIEWAGYTRLNTQIIRVWLDNEKYIDCTPDHKFLTRNGEWKEAQDLKENESLMPYYEGEYKVLKIEWLDKKIDTCDLTIKKYHNFGTEAGVIIHNSTLAAEDIRFARTVERIQRILISELTKIALVHLYAQGYDGESLTNFELSLTTPSIIYDQERIALLKEKTDLATSLIENNLVPSDWVYDNIFHFSENQYEGYRDLISEDKKRKFRWAQIESEGNDPMETGEIYGTPSQLSSMNLKDRYPGNSGTPEGYDPTNNILPEPHLGRPKEKASIYNTQDSALGKDRTGSYGMKKDNADSDEINPPTKKGALKLENTQIEYLKNKDLFKNIRKDTLFRENQLLNEGNILNEDELI